MKKLHLAAAAALLAVGASTLTAQDAQPQGQAQRGQGGGRMMAALFQGITLTADQQTKIDSITAKYMGVRQAAMQDQSPDQDARRAKMREIMRQQSDEMKTVLTDDQKKVFDKNLEDMRARMQQGGRPQ
jgi:Spy/CpxP family protein refolding chaperone